MFKNRSPSIATFLVTLTYVKINLDQNLQLTSLWLHGRASKNAIYWYKLCIWRLLEIDRKQAQVWANMEANSWRLMVGVLHWRVISNTSYDRERWEMITNGLKSPNDLY